MNNAEMFYVAMTRAQNNAFVYANDDKILDGMERFQTKTSVLDAVQHWEGLGAQRAHEEERMSN